MRSGTLDVPAIVGMAEAARLANGGLAEEAPHAYKDIDRVVNVVHSAGLALKVARMVPLGVMKG